MKKKTTKKKTTTKKKVSSKVAKRPPVKKKKVNPSDARRRNDRCKMEDRGVKFVPVKDKVAMYIRYTATINDLRRRTSEMSNELQSREGLMQMGHSLKMAESYLYEALIGVGKLAREEFPNIELVTIP